MKKIFADPEIEILKLTCCDVVCTSLTEGTLDQADQITVDGLDPDLE